VRLTLLVDDFNHTQSFAWDTDRQRLGEYRNTVHNSAADYFAVPFNNNIREKYLSDTRTLCEM